MPCCRFEWESGNVWARVLWARMTLASALCVALLFGGMVLGGVGCEAQRSEPTTPDSTSSQTTNSPDLETVPPPPAVKLPELPAGAQARTLLGEIRSALPLSPKKLEERRHQLALAQSDYDADPDDLDNIVWLGRRHAYLGDYRRAIEIFTEGAEKHPTRPEPLRHRGHRYITLRQFDAAIADLEHAARLCITVEDYAEADGLPNAAGVPISTLHFNVWYHLGLAQFLCHDWPKATQALAHCLDLAARQNDDQVVAAAYWLCHCLARTSRADAMERILKPIGDDMEILENHPYLSLLLLYKGERTVAEVLANTSDGTDEAIQDATLAYGVARWYHNQGEHDEALRRLEQLVSTGAWPAFGVIAAESDLFVVREKQRQQQSPAPPNSK